MRYFIIGLLLFVFTSCNHSEKYNIEGNWEFDGQYILDQENLNQVYINTNTWNIRYYKIYNDTIEIINPNPDEKKWLKDGLKLYKNFKIKKNEIWIKDAVSKDFKLKYYIDSVTTNHVYLRNIKNEKSRFKSPHIKTDFDEIIFSPISYYSGYDAIYSIKKMEKLIFIFLIIEMV